MSTFMLLGQVLAVVWCSAAAVFAFAGVVTYRPKTKDEAEPVALPTSLAIAFGDGAFFLATFAILAAPAAFFLWRTW